MHPDPLVRVRGGSLGSNGRLERVTGTSLRSRVPFFALVVWVSIVMAVPALAVTSLGASPPGRSGIDGFACVPTVDGPVPVTESSPAFVAVLQADLPSGWVDEEFFVSCSSPKITYKTAVFVRRPQHPSRASGLVAVDPLHSSGIWGMQTLLQPYFVAHNDVHVGVAASHDVVERLVKGANPSATRRSMCPTRPRPQTRSWPELVRCSTSTPIPSCQGNA
jgi:alpha/beta hydrolase family protein